MIGRAGAARPAVHCLPMVERKRLALLAALAALPCCPRGVAATEPVPTGEFFQFDAFHSRFVQARKVVAWRPPALPGAPDPCAVLYMHDGQNLFRPANPYGNGPWDVDRHLLALMRLGTIRRTMVVGIWNGGLDRSREYAPAEALRHLSPELQALVPNGSTDGSQSLLSDSYVSFLADELKPFIDRRFDTLTGRQDTVIMGSSMGALASLTALVSRPDVFGAAGCLSTHWPVTTQIPLLLPEPDDRVPLLAGAVLAWLTDRLPAAGNHRLYFDRGTAHLDSLYPPYQFRMDAIARARGYRQGWDVLSRVFEGEGHGERVWRGRLAIPLGFLLRPQTGDLHFHESGSRQVLPDLAVV